MKKLIKPVSAQTAVKILKVADGTFSVASLFFALRIITVSSLDEPVWLYSLLAYVFFALSKILQAVPKFKSNKLVFSVNIIYAVILTVAGLFVFLSRFGHTEVKIYAASFCVIVITNRIISIIRDHRIRNILFNLVFGGIFVYYMVDIIIAPDDSLAVILTVHVVVTFITVLAHIIAISFSQMRLGIIKKILRKTYAAEILYGLALLIVSFSFVFEALEENINSYVDALWYSFAVVTTIGFGDVTVTAGFSRAISVILGIYGIVVVALITSVIVNFYNEVKDEADDGEKTKTDTTVEE